MTNECRHCKRELTLKFLDLGHAPPSNAYLTDEDLSRPEVTFPLRLWVCSSCRLVQTEDFSEADQLFTDDYAYFSSTSKSWLAHAAEYVEMIVERLSLNSESHVIEVASNDGYLLKNFLDKDIPCLGVEPTKSTAEAAEALGISVLQEFFGEEMAKALPQADLILGNNVYAHVPDINDFTLGLAAALKPQGVVTLEFPHLMRLVEFNQFDTVYHEHFSYLSLLTVTKIMSSAGLRIFDVEELPTHGGSLRVYACLEQADHASRSSVAELLAEERRRGLEEDNFYSEFQSKAESVRNEFLRFLLDARRDGKSVAAYGAAAKGNTLANFAGIKPDLIPFVCDAAASKQGKYLPGSHIPIRPPSALDLDRPDYLVVFPWNIMPEVRAQLTELSGLGTKFVTAVPGMKIS